MCVGIDVGFLPSQVLRSGRQRALFPQKERDFFGTPPVLGPSRPVLVVGMSDVLVVSFFPDRTRWVASLFLPPKALHCTANIRRV